MKTSTQHFFKGRNLMISLLLLAATGALTAGTYYVRPVGDATSWTSLTGITPAQIITSNAPEIDTVSTYYFAKGTFVLTASKIDPETSLPVQITPRLTTGKIFGGFSGNETTIDLSARLLEDKDENGIVEPWEFVNETVLRGAVPANDLFGSAKRMLTVTGGEVNGVTFFDFYYFGDLLPTATAYSGAIILGFVSSNPPLESDVPANAGKMLYCTVRKIKAGGMGPIMITNQYSIVDNCLFEECSTEGLSANGGGGAIIMNALGGRVQNSVFRNNEAKSNASNAGRGGAIYVNTNQFISTQNNAIIENCLFYNNTAANWGGAIRADAVANNRGVQIINCTMVNNSTNGTGVASVELIQSGLIVNSIVLDDNKDEIRLHSANNFTASNILGTLNGMTASPGTDMITGKNTSDISFVRPTTFVGAIGSPDGDFFDENDYNEIRKANFKIGSAESPAVTTPALSVLPSAYTANSSILIVNTSISTKDLMGIERTGGAFPRTLGAYQFTSTTDIKNPGTLSLQAYSVNGSIVISGLEGSVASVFDASGILHKSVLINSNNVSIKVPDGFYIIKSNNKAVKVIVK